MKERIQKVMAQQGYCSRRAAEQIIREGRVRLNGRPVKLGDQMDIQKDILSVDGERIHMQKHREMIYLAVNKPRGYVTTLDDPHAEKTVASLVADVGTRVYPVGRLDKDSEGLLLMTNDGELTHLLTHPSSKVGKMYRITVRPAPSEEQLIALSSGVVLDDGYRTAPTTLRVVVSEPNRGVMELVLYEGKNRQIRRMCDAVGLDVVRLKRTAIGPLRLGMLGPGQHRPLKKEELIALRGACAKKG